MSTAILLSGQLRSFARCYPTQRWHVLRHFADPHFFLTIQDQPDVDQILAPLLADYGPDRVHVQRLTDPDLTADLTPTLAAAYHQAPYANAAPAHRLLLQHWYQAQVYKHFLSAAADMAPCRFETIIRLRPDLYFHSFEDPTQETITRTDREGHPTGVISFSSGLHSQQVLTPWWGRFGGLNDRFAIMGPEAARAYFDVYSKIPELLANGCPFHPETLLAARLEMSSIFVTQTLRAEFSTKRPIGTPPKPGEHLDEHGYPTRPPEISPIDLAHAALRAS